jgi:(p)ppGpp synthase/HD superfamily hydrolase
MDIRQIDLFFDYKPVFDENPQFIVDDIIFSAKEYLSQDKIEQIQKAYEFAREAHK